MPATVALVEPVGSDLFVSATTGDLTWTARAEARLPVMPGQPIGLRLNLDRAHLFGADGQNLANLDVVNYAHRDCTAYSEGTSDGVTTMPLDANRDRGHAADAVEEQTTPCSNSPER